MRVLVFSDLHCSEKHARDVLQAAEDCELVIGAGDFANQHRGIHRTIDILSDLKCPAVIVPGNNETLDELKSAASLWATAQVLHGDHVTVNGIKIFGIGGGIPETPFGDWSYDFSESQAEQMTADCGIADIFISHSPPFGHVDKCSQGKNRGSRSILQAAERMNPQLFVCGHIHDSWQSTSKLGETLVVNAGPSPQVFDVEVRLS